MVSGFINPAHGPNPSADRRIIRCEAPHGVCTMAEICGAVPGGPVCLTLHPPAPVRMPGGRIFDRTGDVRDLPNRERPNPAPQPSKGSRGQPTNWLDNPPPLEPKSDQPADGPLRRAIYEATSAESVPDLTELSRESVPVMFCRVCETPMKRAGLIHACPKCGDTKIQRPPCECCERTDEPIFEGLCYRCFQGIELALDKPGDAPIVVKVRHLNPSAPGAYAIGEIVRWNRPSLLRSFKPVALRHIETVENHRCIMRGRKSFSGPSVEAQDCKLLHENITNQHGWILDGWLDPFKRPTR